MGLAIDREDFEPEDFRRFGERLLESEKVLRELLNRPGFGVGPRTIGAELELNLVDQSGLPLPVNRRVMAQTVDERVTLEMDRFNLEANLRVTPLAGAPFAAMKAEFEDALAEVRRAARTQSARVAVIGILPTLRKEMLGSDALTPTSRFRALSKAIRARRHHRPYDVRIHGEDTLALEWDDVTLEGANTSLQFHLRVNPGDFARIHNAAQLATAPVLAISTNSPLFLGKRLWEETRVALFRQAVDDREEQLDGFHAPARVSFGQGWTRLGAHELFASSVHLHTPFLPVVGEQSPAEALARGELPGLAELRLHHGTVWTWNRAVYDPADGGHVRVEFRALPAGPTVVDMIANGAFLIGLTLGLSRNIDELLPSIPFRHARLNFYRAAQRGLDAELFWPSSAPSPSAIAAPKLIEKMLPIAREGLVENGVEPADADRWLQIIERRLGAHVTGARWMRHELAHLEAHQPRQDALVAMTERYLALSEEGAPVHLWPKR